jgi:branched-chain amino acid transport system ATP-binding protein
MLELRNICAKYGEIEVLHDVSVSISEGEFVSIVGANGAGKSTTLKVITSLISASGGELLWDNKPINGLPPYKIAALGIAHVPEGRRVFPQLTVEENLEMGSYLASAKKHRKESMDRVYESFPRLAERRTQLGGTLSGGEQQMLAIGRGLMLRPRLLLLDEPSLGLAPVLVELLFEKLKEIHEQGLAILLVEQNVLEALELADRAYVLENGYVTMEGAAEDVLHDDHVRTAYLGI